MCSIREAFKHPSGIVGTHRFSERSSIENDRCVSSQDDFALLSGHGVNLEVRDSQHCVGDGLTLEHGLVNFAYADNMWKSRASEEQRTSRRTGCEDEALF